MMDPADFTFENLSEMKFNDLYKLSVQLNLVKRRAKKQELIEKLLALKTEKTEENKWRDGSAFFKDSTTPADEEDRRLTFNVEKESDRRLTFEVPQEKSILFNKEDARETYEVAQTNLIDSRATFEVPKKISSPAKQDSRETFELPNKNPLNMTCEVQVEKLNVDEEDRRLTFDVVKEKKIKSPMKINPQIKMLTIPMSRVSRSSIKKATESPKKDDNPSMRISKKSIAIKKTNKDIRKSPMVSRVKLINVNRTPMMTKSKTLIFDDKNPKNPGIKKPEEINKENIDRSLRRRKSKTEDNAVVKKPNPVKVSFLSPQISNRLRSSLPGRATPGKNLLPSSKIPKPTKMPDFASIHKKQFEQMDSLHDYKRKKEERARKLFGTPQPGPQNKTLKKPTVFQFQSSNIPVKPLESKFGKSVENLESKNLKKDAVKNKTAPRMQTDIKDRNRSHIHGVRTNKRFELQMRFRNL